MELQILDPFGDYESSGYLRNSYQEKDLRVVGHLGTGTAPGRDLRERSLESVLAGFDMDSSAQQKRLDCAVTSNNEGIVETLGTSSPLR